jgi:hypothetical protein
VSVNAIRIAVYLAIANLPLQAARASSDLADTLTSVDLGRLAQFAEAREGAIKSATESGSGEDVALLEKILGGEEMPIRGEDIRDDYRCRVAKLGSQVEGLSGLVIYDWFRCRISEDDIGYYLEKTTGSQRLSGHFIDDSETGLIFYGADHYGDEQPRSYDDDPDRNVVGRFVKVGKSRYRLEMPLPFLESRFDILELEER